MPATKTSEVRAGRVALVTGAARGIGQAAAVGLAERGARLVLAGHGDMSQTSDLIVSTGRQVIHRRAEPADIAGSVFLLAADEAAWITGQTIMANGGNAFGL